MTGTPASENGNNSNLQDEVSKKIQEIEGKSTGGNYLYRGEPEHYKRVASSLYQQYQDAIEAESFNVDIVQDEILSDAKRFTHKTDEIEILSELQHFGGKTNLIDFSTDYRVALFFACDGSFDQCGRVILCERNSCQTIEPNVPSNRIEAQRSIFVRAPNGYIEPDPEDVVNIPARLKQPILDHLREEHSIATETIYNDLHGFIKNHVRHESAYTEFYRAFTSQDRAKMAKSLEEKKRQLEESVVQYTRSLESNPNLAEAYTNRGLAKSLLGQNKAAIADHSRAIRRQPKLAGAYTNRGIAKNNLGQHEAAVTDHDQAIRLWPDFAEAYNNRGTAKERLGQLEAAIADHSKAIHLKSDYAEAYSNRGNSKTSLGRSAEAIEDYDEALRLDPNLAVAFNSRGLARVKLCHYEAAIADFDQAINLGKV